MIVYKVLLFICLLLLTMAKYELEDWGLIHITIDAFIIVVFVFLMFPVE